MEYQGVEEEAAAGWRVRGRVNHGGARYIRHGLLGVGVLSALFMGERSFAQDSVAPHEATFRLAVRPLERAAATRSPNAGLHRLDSVEHYFIYVPEQCAGPHRCPLVVFLYGESYGKERMYQHIAEAAKYGMLFLATAQGYRETLDQALRQVLDRFAVDPKRIALAGYDRDGAEALVGSTTNPEVFSRVVALTPTPVAGKTLAWPRRSIIRLAVVSGPLGRFGERILGPLSLARELRDSGYTVDLVLSLGDGMDKGAADYSLMWRWLHATWRAPQAAARSVSTVDLPLLTPQTLAQWTAFWSRFIVEPDSIRTTARRRYVKEMPVPIGQIQPMTTMMDLPALAAKYPSVAADLWAAGLTAEQAEAYRIALMSAYTVVQAVKHAGNSREGSVAVNAVFGIIDPTSVLGRNVAFMKAHADDLEVFEATYMWSTP